MKGLLFNIQKFSLHDGPGIRTVVFFQGCPLSCRWCSNPESQPARGGKDARYYPLAEILEICLQDRPFYEESGGGVTLSGGEVLAQSGFAAALLTALKEENIHTAIETSGYAPPAVFMETIGPADALLFDLKHYDRERHLAGTGVDNGPILANLKSAADAGKETLPRIPVIPGYNNALADAEGFSRLIRDVGLERAQLLLFHQFGEKKYENLSREYAMRGVPQLHTEDVEEYRQVFIAHGIDCFL
jgi:pyruvate formate lyase activating enzyme